MEDSSKILNSHDEAADDSAVQLLVEVAETCNYAAWQNAVPLVKDIAVVNASDRELTSLFIELTSSNGFARNKRWGVDRVGPCETFRLKSLDIEIDPQYLDSLDEAERSVLTFRLLQSGESVYETTRTIRVLAKDEWGGMPTMAELLPAFVMPNEPALASLLRSAAWSLGQAGHTTSLDGYQSSDPNRSYLLAAALWSAIAGRALVYANPPGSFEQVGQKTRRAEIVLQDGLATCLDTTLLFASGLEAIGLNPVIVMMRGHCFAGVWLAPKTFKGLVERDCSEIRKAITAKELLVFETTMVTHSPPAKFPEAVAVATAAVAEEKEHEFVAVIDVARARMSQILPLASRKSRTDGGAADTQDGPLPLPEAPGYAASPTAQVDELPRTPAGRIERWQRKLLDLSLRNRLLNFRPSKQTVPVLCPDVSRLEDRLADGARMRLISLSDANPIVGRDAELHQKRTQKDLEWEYARRALDRDEVACPIDVRELESRLTALFRKVRNDLAEGGSNTLYLAVGFLRWKQKAGDENTYRAPLLLAPVKLIRRSASSPYYLANHEDEVRFNATLLQLLKKDFDCDLTAFESNLPMDDSGVDVAQVLDRMRLAVRDIPGFEVVEEAAVAPFSFAKYLMWKDLVDRVGKLEHNRVVRHLIHEPDKAFVTSAKGAMPQSYEMDTRYAPADLVHPLPADSSQLAAVMAAAEGHDLVIVGPPGTGKSQTIANLIAQCLANRKTVLFVAEKTAALDVVHRRLKAHGLGDCCLELHSSKAERRRFLDQLEASWKHRGKGDKSDWVDITEQLRIRRDQLNAYAAAVHMPDDNGWTAYRAMGECVRGRQWKTPPLDWSPSVRHSRAAYAEVYGAVVDLAATFAALPAGTAALRTGAVEWSMAWESSLLDTCRAIVATSERMSASIQAIAALLGIPSLNDVSSPQLTELFRLSQELARPDLPFPELMTHGSLDQLSAQLAKRQELLKLSEGANAMLANALSALCELLGDAEPNDISEVKKRKLYRFVNEVSRATLPPPELVFKQDFEGLLQSLDERPKLLAVQRDAFESLKARSFNGSLIDRIKVDELEHEWSHATGSLWPLSMLRKRGVAKKLKAYLAVTGVPAPEVDLPLLREYKVSCVNVLANLEDLGLSPQLRGLVENDVAALTPHLESAKKLRESIDRAGFAIEQVAAACSGSLERIVAAARGLYGPNKEVDSLRSKLNENLAQLNVSPQLQAVVETEAAALDDQIKAAGVIRRALTSLGVPAGNQGAVVQAIAVLHDTNRRAIAGECRHSAKAFQEA